MNREIKFRVWNNKTKCWVHGPHERSDLDGVNLFGETILLGGFMDGVSITELNDCVALQYTGLKDKNGKEIYENDILHTKSLVVYPDWGNGGAYIDIKGIGTFTLTKQLVDDFKFEVIGNIFDNPELLK